ncbi:rubrerythrin family protein [Vampirovibrio sp.]|uniref:rubrerythrin family protein n=1 Tax=Vampirovibrio sp. TaxID=2717857 RepID=UPI0035948E33
MQSNSETSLTAKNIESAFAGESMANRKYLYFAKIAKELGNTEVAQLFEDVANQETGHAFAHLQLLYPKADMTVEKLLELARDGELYETNHMYPDFERVAIEEGEAAAVAEFQEQAAESKVHANLFQKAAQRFKALGKVEALHAAEYDEALQKVRSAS